MRGSRTAFSQLGHSLQQRRPRKRFGEHRHPALSATPVGAHTSTAPSGSHSSGKQEIRKDLTKILVAHNIPHIAQTTSYRWKDLAREAVDCNFWPIFEVENGVYTINKKPKDKMPVGDRMKKHGLVRCSDPKSMHLGGAGNTLALAGVFFFGGYGTWPLVKWTSRRKRRAIPGAELRSEKDEQRGPLQVIKKTTHAADHPIGFPEGAYLKCIFGRA